MSLRKLAEGYLAFREDTYLPEKDLFHRLAEKQEPKVMMVSCSDSRVDPAIVCNADPGDLFMVRNVANLVPPHALDEAQHGTSAALEFAVRVLDVEHILVMGHGGCGGIRALYTGEPTFTPAPSFIANWMRIADEARRRTMIAARHRPLDQQLRLCEEEAIKSSLANLLTFPWISERVASGRLRIHGWHFDIEGGAMDVYVPRRDRFEPLTVDLASELESA